MVEDRAYFVRNAAGRAFRVVGALRDITERKRLEEARVAAAASEAARQELEAFNYSVSHDLRAPLRPLHGFSQALVEDYGDKLDAKAHEYLARIRAAAQRMGQLIEDLFRLSRTGLAEMSVGTVDLAALAEAIVSDLRNEDATRGVTFVSGSDLRVSGDPGLLRIALENLLANAWKFTRKTAAPRIEVGSYRDAGGTVFFVRDNGAGFHQAGASRLFQPFRRLHPASEFEGTGIGLAIVDRVIRRHGGRIWVDAHEGRGATFYFTLRR
jgi:signal transduction histidine kinase